MPVQEVSDRAIAAFSARAARAARGTGLRVWDRIEGDLVERAVEGERAASLVLDLYWVVAPGEGYDAALRIAHGDPPVIVPSREEARRAEAEARRVEAEARAVAERRVAELEAELARHRG